MRFFPTLMLVLSILLLTNACSDKKEHEAKLYLEKANMLFEDLYFVEAHLILDTLPERYPLAYSCKAMANQLRNNIIKKESTIAIDSLIEQVNSLQTKIVLTKHSLDRNLKIETLQGRIDSLNKKKDIFQKKVNMIRNEELEKAARTQCITCIRATRAE